jgi:16S rRNA processing protein RimM
MINKESCLLLGKLAKPHGTKGSLVLWSRNMIVDDFKKKESVFAEIDGLLVPFFVESFKKISPETAIMKFEDIDSETQAKAFAGIPVYMLKEQVRKKRKTSDGMPSFSGYKVFDMRLGFVGTAGEINDIANNPLLQVNHEGKDFLIPAHGDIILEINEKKKEIKINAPEGLFEI